MAQARHRDTPTTRDPEYDLLATIGRGIAPYALRLRDFIMQNAPLFRYPPGLEPSSSSSNSPIKIPSLATRRAACTHLTMVRLYGNFRCNVCDQTSQLGWVYSCTQDETPVEAVNQQLQRLDDQDRNTKYGTNLPNDDREQAAIFSMPNPDLSPSVEKAIRDGHYTEEQVTILRAQKQNVIEVAKVAVEKFEESQRAADFQSLISTKSESVDANPHLPFPLIHEVRDTPAGEGRRSGQRPIVTKLKMFPQCEFRACQCCRPIYRDRSWLCLEEVFAMKPPIPAPAFADDNRPVARASVLKSIGLRLRRGRPRLRHLDSRTFYSFDGQGKNLRPRLYRSSCDSSDSSDIADESVEPESKGFRESMKRGFRAMLTGHQHPARLARKRKAKESTTSDEDVVEFDMGLWKKMNDDLLKEASSIPLPLPTKDSLDGLSVEIEKTDIAGVAVTEEAAEMKSADIILSV